MRSPNATVKTSDLKSGAVAVYPDNICGDQGGGHRMNFRTIHEIAYKSRAGANAKNTLNSDPDVAAPCERRRIL